MYSKFFQRLKHQACVVLFGIVLISACTVSAGAVVLHESGAGTSLYNSVWGGHLPSYRPSGYDYSCMSINCPDGMNPVQDYMLYLVYSDSELAYNDGRLISRFDESYGFNSVDYVYLSSEAVASLVGLPARQWVIFSECGVTSVSVPNVNWSDYDLYSSSGDLLCPSSVPISLDGYDLVLWDGDTSNLSFSNNLAEVGLYVPVPDSVYCVRAGYSGGSPVFSHAGDPPLSDLVENGNSWSVPSTSSVPYVLSDSSSGKLFFSSASVLGIGGFTYFLAYKPASVIGPDFSSTTLTASNPQYDYQSAEFDVSWSNLPEIPYPDNVQYFIQGRLNDGSAAQPPEIYLGSSSDPPTSDVPVSFSFTNLQPETQYTATFELVYNTTGSFRDFIRSGVTSTVSFTTLSDGSISEGDKAIINAIQNANKDNQQWTDSQFGSSVGDLPEDTTETDNLISGLDQQEEAYKDDAYDRFQELSSAFSGFDGTVGSGIGLAGTLFSRFFNALGSYKIIYTFPLLLGLAMVLIGRLGRSSIRMEREPGDHS